MVREKKIKKADTCAGDAGDVAMADAAADDLAHLEIQRTRVICGPDINFNVG